MASRARAWSAALRGGSELYYRPEPACGNHPQPAEN